MEDKLQVERDYHNKKLHTEQPQMWTQWDEYVRQVSSEMVLKDTQIISLQERETTLRTELERSRKQTERYKQHLRAGLNREKVLEKNRVQMELEWQRRFEDVKADYYLANEQLIQDLIEARDQAKAELMEREQQLHDLTVLLQSTSRERDQAVQVDSLASVEIRRLQEQNSALRAVVTQMRKDMEGLGHLLVLPHAEAPVQPPYQESSASKGNTADGRQPVEQEVHLSGKPLEEQRGGGLSGLASATEDPQHIDPGRSQPENQAGGSCLDERGRRPAVTHVESASNDITQQRTLVQQLQGDSKCVKAALMCGVFKSVHPAKNDPQLLRVRLKQAASYIARLSREKQQLIALGNRLRAQIAADGRQAPGGMEKDTPTEKLGDHHGSLSAVEQLQYQLTTQELQYALMQRASTAAEQHIPPTKSQAFFKGTANTCHGLKPRDTSETRSQLHLSRTVSHESLCSLTMLWETLDRGLTDSEGERGLRSRQSGGSGVQMMVHGSGVIPSQPQTEVQQSRSQSKTLPSTIKTNRPSVPARISKIRNYNVKD
ncbi:coiled-coil domain-containing protein 57 isoform X1 [Simochromis diagramma]|uniref:coiled-coil domain-containing protein 57 isoform X1 n=1 Tax=Simochromis diagramma TaxID=43689 RepID=UPI001A7E8FAB|nr:coiled-coil domain-containing protein 57 isoform X1 [Simochromis diagramma]